MLAVLILHEPLSVATVLGMALLLTAVVLVRPPRPGEAALAGDGVGSNTGHIAEQTRT